ncbi:MAG: pyrroline-5-carboxylate reductase [Verrucomicrobia bacterium]|nr:pyrroline-5-carboxylate reductase [Verrucomicrobiota bacterium]
MQFGVVGCGRMGTALVAGAIRTGVVQAAQVRGVEPDDAAAGNFHRQTGAAVSQDPASLAGCDVLLLCTKPAAAVDAACLAVHAIGNSPVLMLSIAAGITTCRLEQALPASARVCRSMPNTPALVGHGASAYCLGSRATRDDAAIVGKILGAVGLAVELPESHMDAVTGLSGSGPAYAHLFIEAMTEGAVRCGIPREDALKLAAHTVRGAAQMVIDTGLDPASLRDMVTSPGGTTLAGLQELERHNMPAAIIDAVAAATRRATELGS